jgi:hypothetical protein
MSEARREGTYLRPDSSLHQSSPSLREMVTVNKNRNKIRRLPVLLSMARSLGFDGGRLDHHARKGSGTRGWLDRFGGYGGVRGAIAAAILEVEQP